MPDCSNGSSASPVRHATRVSAAIEGVLGQTLKLPGYLLAVNCMGALRLWGAPVACATALMGRCAYGAPARCARPAYRESPVMPTAEERSSPDFVRRRVCI